MLVRVVKARDVDDASGNSKVMYKRPSSSIGINPVGFALNKNIVPVNRHTNKTMANTDFLMIHLTPCVYLSVSDANHLSKR